jgi:hypothetical protein
MGALDAILFSFVTFLKSLWGIIVTPYQSMRHLIERNNLTELLYVALMLIGYFALASVVKVAEFRPFLLTRQFALLTAATAANYLFLTGSVYSIARVFGGRGTYRQFAIGWAYSLVPTVCWFLATSILYVLLPPPRTTSLAGTAFSLLFLTFSTTLLFWKIILVYLTVRFSMRLDLLRITATIFASAPLLTIYAVLMYRWGVFRVPFF